MRSKGGFPKASWALTTKGTVMVRCYILSQKPGCGPREESCAAKITGYLGCWGGLWRQQKGILGAASPLSRPQTSGRPSCPCPLQQWTLNQENRTSCMAQKTLLLKPGKRKSLIFCIHRSTVRQGGVTGPTPAIIQPQL